MVWSSRLRLASPVTTKLMPRPRPMRAPLALTPAGSGRGGRRGAAERHGVALAADQHLVERERAAHSAGDGARRERRARDAVDLTAEAELRPERSRVELREEA